MKKSFAVVIALLVSATNALPQSFTIDSFNQAKSALDRSVAAYGGREALNAIQNVSIKIAGESVHRFQSRRPGDFDRTAYNGELVIDWKNSRAMQTQKGHYPGGFQLAQRLCRRRGHANQLRSDSQDFKPTGTNLACYIQGQYPLAAATGPVERARTC